MKSFLGIFFIVCFVSGFSQIVSFNESTTLLNKPNGKPAFQINAGVEYWYHYPGFEDVWAEIDVPCFVLKTAIVNAMVEKGTQLLDYHGNRIGSVLLNAKYNDFNLWYKPWDIMPDSLQQISLTGFIEKEKFEKNPTLNEIMKNNTGYYDSSVSRVFTFNNTIGQPQTIREDDTVFYSSLNNGKSIKKVLVKEKLITKTSFQADGDFRSMIVEITQDYDTDHPQTFLISNDAYKCSIDKNLILFSEYNWSAGPEERYLYSVSTFNQLMNFHGDLYTISIPNSNIEGFIGYKPVPKEWESTYTGYLYFATPEKVLINKKIICRKKELIDKLTIFDAKITYVSLDNRDVVCNYDSTRFILNSKSGCENETCLTDFRIIMSLGYDIYNISITLEFRDGDVFLVKNYEDAFELR